jgi:predicted DNA-binding transcriptional regulator AlpA
MRPITDSDLMVTLTISEFRTLVIEIIEAKLSVFDDGIKKPKDATLLYNRLEVAKLFGVSSTTIDKWRRFRILPPSIKIASRVYFYQHQIQEFIKQRERNPDKFLNL